MTWEAVSALSSIITGIVILLTVVFAARQVRILAAQNEDAHRANQLDGMMRIFELLHSPEFENGRKYILMELPALLDDPTYVETLRGPVTQQPWYHVMFILEEMGVFIRFGYLEGPPFYYNYSGIILGMWPSLNRLIDVLRTLRDNPYIWKDTEWMSQEALVWAQKYAQENPLIQPSTGKTFDVSSLLGRPPGYAGVKPPIKQ